MGVLLDSLDIITENLRENLSDDVDVSDHPGRFTDEELGKTIRKRKSVRVAIEDIPSLMVDGSGRKSAEVKYIVFVICSDTKGADRHKEAVNLIEELTGIITYQRWSKPEVFRAVEPGNITVENLYSGEISNGKGIAWWSISWQQAIRN